MFYQTTSSRCKGASRVWLYSVVFAGRVSLLAVLFLFVSFFIQPFHQALANETEPEITDLVEEVMPTAEDVKEQVAVVIEEPDLVEEVEAVNDSDDSAETEVIAEVDLSNGTDENLDEDAALENEDIVVTIDDDQNGLLKELVIVEITDTEVSSTTEQAATTTIETIDTGTEALASSSQSVASSTETVNGVITASTTLANTSTSSELVTPGDSSATADQEAVENPQPDAEEGAAVVVVESSSAVDNTGSSDQDSISESAAVEDNSNGLDLDVSTSTEENVATSSVSKTETIVQAQFLVTEDNYYQFNRQACVAVGDGTYHCSLDDGPVVDAQTVVYADKDSEGDLEIYMRTSKGAVEKITDNSFDDTSPHFDAESLRIVWQSLINGRYQVMVYDLTERETVQLTFSRTNNMEPKVSSDGIVWQAWDNHDWEIMFFDGSYTDQLTDNEIQDVTPVIEDGYVLWSVLGGDNQEAQVYSLESGETLTISGHDGGTIANPRFVLVYDTKFDNGDVITQGFDPVTGLSELIASEPAAEPIEIPDTDTTGETRALIQNKSNQKENEIVNRIDSSPDLTSDPSQASSTINTAASTLNLNQVDIITDISEVTVAPTEIIEDFELTDFDLVITAESASTTTNEVLSGSENSTTTSTQV